MELTDKQKHVLYSIVKGVRDQNILRQTLGGYAGTGKSVLVSYLSKFFPKFAPCAYTGKAADVLRKKGLNSSTIHSLIYKPVYDFGRLVGFDLVPREELPHDGFIVDEASMVSSEIYSDLMSYFLPTVYVGDHGQLQPIGSDFNLMKKPDYTLEEIHRNAGDIAKFAGFLRNGVSASKFKDSTQVQFKSQKKLTTEDLIDSDQIICAYNKTRIGVNNRVREGLGFSGTLNVGERIMCLKNNKNLHLFNGMQGIVRNLYEDDQGRKLLDLEVDSTLFPGVWYDTKQFGEEKPEMEYIGKEYPNPFDYAYCITCHKSQGSEFDRVIVMEQKCAHWSHARWAYTAASRAKENLLWAY